MPRKHHFFKFDHMYKIEVKTFCAQERTWTYFVHDRRWNWISYQPLPSSVKQSPSILPFPLVISLFYFAQIQYRITPPQPSFHVGNFIKHLVITICMEGWGDFAILSSADHPVDIKGGYQENWRAKMEIRWRYYRQIIIGVEKMIK